jgi:hypothetical protein
MTDWIRIRSTLRRCAAALLVGSVLPSNASAKPSKDQCIDADTLAQDLRRAGKLLSARAALQVCIDPACPGLVRDDCAERLDELKNAIPSLIFSAKDGNGREIRAVAVTIDGKPTAYHLDGSAIDVDPGEHTFDFRAAGLPPASLELRIREGERRRHQDILLGPPAAGQASSLPPGTTSGDGNAQDSATSAEAEARASSSGSTQRLLAWTALGLGATGIVVGTVFGLKSKSKHDDAKACGTTCPDEPSYQANEDAIKFGNISTVSFIVGAVGLAGGVTLWLTEKPRQTNSRAQAQITVGLGSLQFRGTF